MSKERLLMLWWVKTGQVRQRQELYERLGRTPATVTRWLATYRQGGLSALLTVKTAPGAPPRIQGETLTKLQQQLKSKTGFSSDGEIVEWLREACDFDLKYDTVNRFVRDKLQAKLKVPRPQSLKQHVAAVNGCQQTSERS